MAEDIGVKVTLVPEISSGTMGAAISKAADNAKVTVNKVTLSNTGKSTLRKSIESQNLTINSIKVKKIDASEAVASLKTQLETIFGSLQTDSLKLSIDDGKLTAVYNRVATNASNAAQSVANMGVSLETAKKRAAALDTTYKSMLKTVGGIGTDKEADLTQKYKKAARAAQEYISAINSNDINAINQAEKKFAGRASSFSNTVDIYNSQTEAVKRYTAELNTLKKTAASLKVTDNVDQSKLAGLESTIATIETGIKDLGAATSSSFSGIENNVSSLVNGAKVEADQIKALAKSTSTDMKPVETLLNQIGKFKDKNLQIIGTGIDTDLSKVQSSLNDIVNRGSYAKEELANLRTEFVRISQSAGNMQGTNDFETMLKSANQQMSTLSTTYKSLQNSISKSGGAGTDRATNLTKQYNELADAYQRYLAAIKTGDTSKIDPAKANYNTAVANFSSMVEGYNSQTEALKRYKTELASLKKAADSLSATDNVDISKLSTLKSSIADIETEIGKLGSASQADFNNIASGIDESIVSAKGLASEMSQTAKSLTTDMKPVYTLLEQIRNYELNNPRVGKSEYGGELASMKESLQGFITEGKYASKSLSELQVQFLKLKSDAESSGNAGSSFVQKITSAFASLGKMAVIRTVAMNARQALLEVFNAVKDVDDAMTQLKIVTGATDSQMDDFFSKAVASSESLGASVSDVLDSIQVFSRLGYNLEESNTLASAATVLSNVAAVDVDSATSGLTSIIKAYDMDISEVDHVQDVLVSIGQKYAISAEELMEAYERGGAALAATGTSFEKSAALFAAGNAALQDASTVGTALKTVSARIRGAKTDLEELGEDTDDLAEGFSKYREELMALTGVDIMENVDTNEYKDIYDIFVDISGVWGELSDTSQARVAEILGGTRQLSVISSILTNISDATGAYTDAMNSAGIATEANEIYIDSISGKIAKLQSVFQSFSADLLDSSLVKGVVSAATTVLKLFDSLISTIGAIPTAALSGGVIAFIKNFSKIKNSEFFQRVALDAAENGISQLSVALQASAVSAEGALAALAPLAPVIAAVAAAFALFYIGNHFSLAKDFEQLSEAASDAREELQSTQQEIQSLESELESVNDQIDTINAKDGLSLTDKAELAELQQQKELLESQLEIKERIAEIQGSSAAITANDVLTAKDFADTQQDIVTPEGVITTSTVADIIEYTKHKYDELQEAQKKYSDLSKEQDGLEPDSKAYKKNEKLLQSYATQIEELGNEVSEKSGIIQTNYENIIQDNGVAKAGFESTAAAAEEFFDYIMSGSEKAADTESKIATVLARADFAGVKDKLISVVASGEAAIDEEIANTAGLQAALDAAGISADDLYTYIANLAGSDLGNIEEQVRQLKEDFAFDERTWQGQAEFQEFIDGLSDEEIHIFYDYVNSGDFDLSQWDMDDVEYNFKIAMDDSEAEAAAKTIADLEDRMSDLNDVLSEQASATGLTSESIQTVKDMFSDLDSYNQEALFEETAMGVRLNRTELERLNEEYDQKQIASYDDKLAILESEYASLADTLAEYTDEEEREGIISSMKSKANEIDDVRQLKSEYEGLTSAYNKWVNAQSTDNDRDSYVDIAEGYEDMKKIFDAGWFNDDSLTAYLDVLLGTDRVDDTVEAWGQLTKTIDGTKHSVMDYFQQDEDGNILTDGLFAFLDDVNSVFGDAYASYSDEAGYAFDLTDERIDEISQKFGMGREAILLMVSALRDVGEVDLDPIETSMDSLTEKAKEAGMTVDEYVSYWNDRGVQFSVGGEVVLDTSKAEKGIDSIDGEDVTATVDVDADTTDAEQKIDAVDNATPEVKAEVDVDTPTLLERVANAIFGPYETDVEADTSGVAEDVDAAVNNADKTATVQVTANVAGTEDVQKLHDTIELVNDKEVKVLANTKNSTSLVTRLINAINKLRNKTVTITTINRTVKTSSQAKSTNGSEGTGRVRGTAHKGGTAHSSGRYGTSATERVLIGEVGPELAVDPATDSYTVYGENGAEIVTIPKGSIIFDAVQTEDLLSGGYTSSYGHALINGTAYSTGTNLKKRTSTTKASSAASSSSSSSAASSSSSKKSSSKKSSSKSSSKAASSALEKFQDWFEKLFDWIEVKLTRLERLTDNYVQRAEAKAKYGNYGKIASSSSESNTGASKWYIKALDSISKQLTANEKGATKYQSEANAVLNKAIKSGIITKKQASNIKTKVANGTINISEYGEKMREVIQDYQEWYEKSLDCSDAVQDLLDQYTELAEALYNLPLDKLNDQLEELSEAEDLLDAKYDIAGTAAEKNAILEEQNANAAAVKDANIAAAETATKNLQTAMEAINETTDTALKGLTSAQKKQIVAAVKAGETIDYTKYGTSLSDKGKKAIIEYNAALEANEEASYNAEKASYEYTASLRDTAQEMFNNINDEWGNMLSVNDYKESMVNEFINQAEAKGYMLGKDFYEALIRIEEQNLAMLQQQQAALLSALEAQMKAGNIKSGTAEWYEMCAAIDSVTLSIEQSKTSLLEYNNQLRQVEWDAFDTAQDYIENITDEADFLIDLLSSNDDLFDDAGNLNSKGEAVAGLHAVNYNTDMALADRYADELASINAQIASDPYDTDLLDRRQELLEAQRDAIQAAEDEKEALRDLIEDGIDAQIDAMSDLIDKYLEALDAQKELYDYQNTVKDKVKEIASLQKQISSLAGDTSEENKATVQKLKVSLEEAQQDLEETEYDKYISDQKELLDQLQDDFEDYMNERLDNIDGLFSDMIAAVNSNSDEIWSTIQTEANNVGYTVTDEMENIWSNADSVVTMYGSGFLDQMTTVNQTIISVGNQIAAAIAQSSAEAASQIGSITSATELTSGITAESDSTSSGRSDVSSLLESVGTGIGNTSTGTTSAEDDRSNYDVLLPTDYKSRLKKIKKIINAAPTKTSKVYNAQSHSDLSKYIYKKSGNHAVTNADMAAIGQIMGISATEKNITGNSSMKNEILKILKAYGYSSGVKKLAQDELAWTQEDGAEAIIRPTDSAVLTPLKAGDSVLNADATSNLYDLLNDPSAFLEKYSSLTTGSLFPSPDMPEISVDIPDVIGNLAGSGGQEISFNFDNLTLPNVTNYEEFKYALQHDSKFEKMVQSMTVGRASGGTALRKYRY